MVHCAIIPKQFIGEREEGGREGGRKGGRKRGRDTMYLTTYPPSKSDESVC